jgi:4-aminobutyrate aminotransferase-like enzyme
MNPMSMINAFDPSSAGALDPVARALIERRQRVLGPAYRLFYEEPLHLVRGEGVWLYDADGAAYLDAYNNVASVGHAEPSVVEAIARQSATLVTHTRYLHEGVLTLAERLLATLPAPLGQVMFTCTGSEANDLAYRIACRATGHTGVIVTGLAYHGVTDAVSAFSPSLGAGVPLGAHVRTVAAPDAYRGDPDVAGAFASNVAAAAADLKAAGFGLALFIVDSIFSSDGVFADPKGFLAPAVEAARAAGGLYLADEVQPGFGRTGESLWGFTRHGLVPDLVSMGKPMGNGYPVAAMVAQPQHLERFGREARYFNTFGGNPVAAAAANAVLDVIERDHLIEHVGRVGAYLTAGLKELALQHEAIGDVRGAGLFIGVDLVSDRAARTADRDLATRIVNGLRRRRILLSASGPGGNVLKIRPPLVFKQEHADLLLTALDELLRSAD